MNHDQSSSNHHNRQSIITINNHHDHHNQSVIINIIFSNSFLILFLRLHSTPCITATNMIHLISSFPTVHSWYHSQILILTHWPFSPHFSKMPPGALAHCNLPIWPGNFSSMTDRSRSIISLAEKTRWMRNMVRQGYKWKTTLGIQSPSENGNGTWIPCWGDYIPQSSSDKVIGSLGLVGVFYLFEKYVCQIGSFSQVEVKKKTCLKPPPRMRLKEVTTSRCWIQIVPVNCWLQEQWWNRLSSFPLCG